MMILSLGPAQPVGVESIAEFMDVGLGELMEPEAFQKKMNAVLPGGISIVKAWVVDKHDRSLNSALREQVYAIEVLAEQDFPTDDLEDRVLHLKNAPEVTIQRRRPNQTKTVDIRPFIKDLEVVAPNQLHLVTRFGQTTGSIRPSEVLEALYPELPRLKNSSRIRKVEALFE